MGISFVFHGDYNLYCEYLFRVKETLCDFKLLQFDE